MPEQSNYEQVMAALGREDDNAERALQLLYGELPAWFPLPRLENARRIVYRLGHDGFTAEQIAKFTIDSMADKWTVPAIVRDSSAFIHAINELAHIKYALSLPDNECLEMLAGKHAANGLESAQAYKRRDEFQDKPECQDIAIKMWEENPEITQAEIMRSASIAPYAKKYKGKNTLSNWLREVDPRPPEKKRGRQKKKN